MITIAVLAGGRSAEHDISLQSASQVLRYLDRQRFAPWPVFLDLDGAWWVGDGALAPGEGTDQGFRTAAMRALRPGAALDRLLDGGVRAVFPVLHGAFGEDGTVQGMCELHDMPCVGSGCAASAVAMDKLRTRECLLLHGVPMAPAWIADDLVERADPARASASIARSIGFPCFLKVDLSGSSTGVARATDADDVARFLAEARHLGMRFLAERAMVGEEISVGVLGNQDGELLALPPIGIYPKVRAAYFTREAKYVPGASEEVIPPRGLSPALIDEVKDLAVRCHRALGCDGMSRTDIIVTADGPVVLEVNTIPGMTATSLLPQCAGAAGLDFTALLSRLLDLALARRPHPVARSSGSAKRPQFHRAP